MTSWASRMDSLAWCQLSSAVVWFGTDRGAAIGQVVYDAVLRDGDDGADPGGALRRLCRAGPRVLVMYVGGPWTERTVFCRMRSPNTLSLAPRSRRLARWAAR